MKIQKFRSVLCWTLVLAASTGWPCAARAQKEVTFSAGGRTMGLDSFNTEIRKIMDTVGIPGLSLAIIAGGRVVFYQVYGYKKLSTREQVDENTLFEACSLSKSFLVLVAHQLVDEGKLNLDKPLYQYLPYPPLEHDQRYKLITARMVLSHSSGLENWRTQNNPDTLEILSDPGTKYIYSGEGYNYLAQVIATILKKPYEQYMAERVIRPLRLDRTFVLFRKRGFGPFRREVPGNYSTGHDIFGEQLDKFKNSEPIPSSNVQVIAKDYAKLIVAMFNSDRLHPERVGEILKPVIPVDKGQSTYFGAGFEVIYDRDDTLISQTGNNYGFKGNFFYSPSHRRGFVYFTNGDRGLLLSQKLAEMTVGFHIGWLFRDDDEAQYPSPAIDLFHIYREKGAAPMFAAIEDARRKGPSDVKTLDEISEDLIYHDAAVAKRLLSENLLLYPRSAHTHELMGRLYSSVDQYDSAYPHFVAAHRLDPASSQIGRELAQCEDGLRDNARRDSLLLVVRTADETMLKAENYNKMKGVGLERTADEGGGSDVAWIDPDDWLDYKVMVPRAGDYTLSFRVASPRGNARMELRSRDTSLTVLTLPATKGWQNWTTLTATTHLVAGPQILRVYAVTGGFNINWIKFHLHE